MEKKILKVSFPVNLKNMMIEVNWKSSIFLLISKIKSSIKVLLMRDGQRILI